MPSFLIKRDARRRDAVFASVEAGERCRNSESESIVPKGQLFYYSYLLLRIRRFAIFFGLITAMSPVMYVSTLEKELYSLLLPKDPLIIPKRFPMHWIFNFLFLCQVN